MTKTIRLSDLQLVLLSSAAARDNGSLIPLPQNCSNDRASIGKAVAALLRRGLIEELAVTNRSLAWREQDQEPVGLFITDAGCDAIGSGSDTDASVEGRNAGMSSSEDTSAAADSDAKAKRDTADPVTAGPQLSAVAPAPAGANSAMRPASKIATVIALLERSEGATLEEMVEATGWLPHTTRAALTGLRKKGWVIAKDRRGDQTCYRIAAETAA